MLNLYLRTKNKSNSKNIQNDKFIYNKVYLPLKCFYFLIQFYEFWPFANDFLFFLDVAKLLWPVWSAPLPEVHMFALISEQCNVNAYPENRLDNSEIDQMSQKQF